MSCDRCGNATRPLAEDNGEMLYDGCLDLDLQFPRLSEVHVNMIRKEGSEILLIPNPRFPAKDAWVGT